MDRLHVWPGFTTRIDDYDGGRFLLLDVAHTVLRQATVLDQMCNEWRQDRQTIQKELIGASVLCRHNNKHYQVDDVDFDQTPRSTFLKHDGTHVTYVDYYKENHQQHIRNLNQPLIMHRERVRFGFFEFQPARY